MDLEILSALVDSSHEAIITTDVRGKVIYCNQTTGNVLNILPEQLTGSDLIKLLDNEDQKECQRILKLIPSENYDSLIFYGHFLSLNDPRPLKIEVKSLKVRENDLILFVVTPYSSQEEETYKLYRLLAENAYDINIMFDESELIYVSPSIKDFLGYEVGDLKSMQDWYDLIHMDERNEVIEQLVKDNKHKEPFSYYSFRQKSKTGEYLWFDTKIRREIQDNGKIVCIATSVDISQRKKFEIELERQKEFIHEIFDTDPNLIFVRDGSGKMIYCNKAVSDLVGLSREEMLSKEKNMFPASENQEQAYKEMEEKVIRLGDEIVIEEQILDNQGVINYFQTLKKPFLTDEGDTHILNISTNINKIKYYERENQNVMKARNEFFSAMSHEIRTPMNAVIGLTELLLKRKPKKEQVKLLETLHFSASNLLSLINDILDFSKIESGKIELEEINFNVKELLENVKNTYKPMVLDKDLALSLNIAEDVPMVINGDYIKLSQILNNLVANAIKFTEKGRVAINVDLHKEKKNKYYIRFEITDTGIGIPANKLDKIFDPFHQASRSTTRKFGGTGLGLSIVRNLVEIQKGEIQVESKPGKGSRFSTIIPYKKADLTLPVNSLPSSTISHITWKMNLHLLYVEDVPTNQFLMEEILGDWGITIDMANDGYEAIDMLQGMSYDLVLMDIQMPGMDGYETTRKIREIEGTYFKDIPILALTASTSNATKDRVAVSGMQDIILKPINVDNLRSKIIEYTNSEDAFDDSRLLENEKEIQDFSPGNVTFDRTDKLFLNNMIRYQDFLKMTIDEFAINLDHVLLAINNSDLITFRQLRHRMKSIIATFGMKELIDLLDDVKERLNKGDLKDKEKTEYSKSIKLHVDYLIDALTNKLASLKWG